MAPWAPDGEIEILAGTPPGGGQDRAARALAAALASVVEFPIAVSNLPGRGGGNVWDALATTPGAGQRIAISSPTLVTNPIARLADLDWRKLTTLALLCTEYIAFGTPRGSAIADGRHLVAALGSATPPTVSLATARGNVNHMALADLCRPAAVDPQLVPVRVFDSARHAVADVLAGGGDVVAVTAASVLPEVAGGELQILGISAPHRLAAPLDTVPTWRELDVDCVIGSWRGVVGAPELTAPQIRFWEDALGAAHETRQWRDALAGHLWSDTYLPPTAAAEFMTDQEGAMRDSLGRLGFTDG